jgi:hypothetical protein
MPIEPAASPRRTLLGPLIIFAGLFDAFDFALLSRGSRSSTIDHDA